MFFLYWKMHHQFSFGSQYYFSIRLLTSTRICSIMKIKICIDVTLVIL